MRNYIIYIFTNFRFSMSAIVNLIFALTVLLWLRAEIIEFLLRSTPSISNLGLFFLRLNSLSPIPHPNSKILNLFFF